MLLPRRRSTGRSFAGRRRGASPADRICPTAGPPRENIAWKTDVPGRGWSSPIVWGDRVFLTTAVNSGELETPKKGLYFGGNRPEPREVQEEYKVLCLDLSSGKMLWEQTVHQGPPNSPIHLKNSFASETPVTDGERVYAYFGNLGLYCFDLEGRRRVVEAVRTARHPQRLGHRRVAGAARRPLVPRQRQRRGIVSAVPGQAHRQGGVARRSRREEQLVHALHLAERSRARRSSLRAPTRFVPTTWRESCCGGSRACRASPSPRPTRTRACCT